MSAAPATAPSAAPRRTVWQRIHRVWVTLGSIAFIVFTAWSLIAYRASSAARAAARSDATILVEHDAGVWRFTPQAAPPTPAVAFVFFPGALVDPRSYAPIARAVAQQGYPAFLVELPRRGAFGGAEDPEVRLRLQRVLRAPHVTRGWVAAGHSRGARVAAEIAADAPAGLAGIVLIGSSHPRDIDLGSTQLPVTKIAGTRDGLASRAEVEQNAARLPASTKWVWIEGGNHSQFGWYGFQPGDRPASISAADQRARMIEAILEMLRNASAHAQVTAHGRQP